MTNLQDKPIVIGTPVEIDKACEDIRQALANITWLSHPYFIAKKFLEKDSTTGKQFFYPETYAPLIGDNQDQSRYPYHRLTPDNDYSGMCFFMIGTGNAVDNENRPDYITYDVGIIFSVNLSLIDKSKLFQGIFTRELMSEARRVIKYNRPSFDFEINFISETDDLQEVYKEFRLDELQAYNRAPLQCFRLNYKITIQELCI